MSDFRPTQTEAGSPQIATYRLRFDDAYFRSIKAALHPVGNAFRWLPFVLIGGSVLLFLVFSAIAIADGDWRKVAVPAVLFGGFLFYVRRRVVPDLARFRRTPDYGSEVRMILTEVRVTVRGDATTSEYRWRSFRSAMRRSDGVLLTLSDRSVLWLPDANLELGSREAVEALLRRNLGGS